MSALAQGAMAIQAPSIEVTAAGGTPILTSGTVNGTGCNGTDGCESSTATVNYAGGSFASVAASGSNSGPNPANAEAEGTVTYFFEVLGPSGSTATLMLTGDGTTSATGPQGSATDQIEWGGGQMYACSGTGNSLASCLVSGEYLPTSFSGQQQTYTISTNVLSDVLTLSTGSSVGAGSFSAAADSTLAFAPSNTCTTCQLVLYSTTISATPEPGTLLLLVAGSGVLAVAVGRRRVRSS